MAQTTNERQLQKDVAALAKRLSALEESRDLIVDIMMKAFGHTGTDLKRLEKMIGIAAKLKSGEFIKVNQPDGSAMLFDGPNAA